MDAAEVVAGLWIGSAPAAWAARKLAAAGVDAVVDLRAERPEAAPWPANVTVHSAPLDDHATPTVKQLRGAAGVVRGLMDEGRTVLVHCRAGLERAPLVAAAALVLQGWSLAEAYRRVAQSRPDALPTEGQMRALETLSREVSTG